MGNGRMGSWEDTWIWLDDSAPRVEKSFLSSILIVLRLTEGMLMAIGGNH